MLPLVVLPLKTSAIWDMNSKRCSSGRQQFCELQGDYKEGVRNSNRQRVLAFGCICLRLLAFPPLHLLVNACIAAFALALRNKSGELKVTDLR